MNTYKDTPSELLNLLVDGELKSEHQPELFSALQQNEALRNEFDELIAIRESVRKDTMAFTPPADAGKALFQRLGFTPPNSAGLVKAPLIKRIWLPVASALVASLFTAVLITNFDTINTAIFGEPSQQKIPVSYSNEVQTPINDINNQNIKTETNSLNNESNALTDKSFNNSSNVNSKNNNQYMPDKPELNNNLTVPQQTDLYRDNSSSYYIFASPYTTNGYNLLPIACNNTSVNNTLGFGSIKEQSDYKLLATEMSFYGNKNGKLLVLLRGIAAMPFQSVPDQTKTTLFSNLGAGAFYKLDNQFRLGAEISQEPFTQSFIYNGNRVTQNPMFLCLTAGARYEMSEIKTLLNAQPYIQLLAGGAIDEGALAGGICKTQIGMQWLQNKGLGAFFGAELTGLFYENQSEVLVSGRGGFTFGIAFGF